MRANLMHISTVAVTLVAAPLFGVTAPQTCQTADSPDVGYVSEPSDHKRDGVDGEFDYMKCARRCDNAHPSQGRRWESCIRECQFQLKSYARQHKAERPLDSQYKTIEAALRRAGLQVCGFHEFGANRGYGYEDTRMYDVGLVSCAQIGSCDTEGSPKCGDVSIEHYADAKARDSGGVIHMDEVINGRHFSTAAWKYGDYLIEVGHWNHSNIASRVRRAMSTLPGATLVYYRGR